MYVHKESNLVTKEHRREKLNDKPSGSNTESYRVGEEEEGKETQRKWNTERDGGRQRAEHKKNKK